MIISTGRLTNTLAPLAPTSTTSVSSSLERDHFATLVVPLVVIPVVTLIAHHTDTPRSTREGYSTTFSKGLMCRSQRVAFTLAVVFAEHKDLAAHAMVLSRISRDCHQVSVIFM